MKNFIYLFIFISFLSVSFSNENTIIFAQGEGYSKYKIFHQEEISNYNVEISLSPINPVVGQQIFSIYISDVNSKEPLENLIVNVYATPLFDDKKKFFEGIPKGLTGENNRGIWERYGRNKANPSGQRIRMVANYVGQAQYRPKYPFKKTVEGVVFGQKRGIGKTFEKNLKQALKTMRKK